MIGIVIALMGEAKPLIDHFKMKACPPKSVFPIYRTDDMYLIVSGIGKVNAALAVSCLQNERVDTQAAWLNVGIAGHRSMAIDTGVIAHQVVDAGTSRSYYPTLLFPFGKNHTVCTVDRPETSFQDDYVYEMEASGFMQAALKFSTSELVHCYKIISDNCQMSIAFNEKEVQKMIEKHLKTLSELVLNLHALCLEVQHTVPSSIQAFTSHWRFTVTEKHQLGRLLTRFSCLSKQSPSVEEFIQLKKAKDVLCLLEKKINAIPLHFHV